MPLFRYFVFIGGTLLALLFLSDVVLPQQSLPSFLNVASSEQPLVRIHSERKWPERIVFDTGMPIVKPAVVAEIPPAPRAAVALTAPVREAFAQLTPAVSRADVKTAGKADQVVAKAAEVKPQPKRKIAKARPSRPMILVAQQPHFGLFASTW